MKTKVVAGLITIFFIVCAGISVTLFPAAIAILLTAAGLLCLLSVIYLMVYESLMDWKSRQ